MRRPGNCAARHQFPAMAFPPNGSAFDQCLSQVDSSMSIESGCQRMIAQLKIIQGAFTGHTIRMPKGKFLVGRESDCHCILDDLSVSRHHCVFILDGWTLRVRDLGSRNGTFVNGNRIGPWEEILVVGDTVAMGRWTVSVAIEGDVGDNGAQPTDAMNATRLVDGDSTLFENAPHPAVERCEGA